MNPYLMLIGWVSVDLFRLYRGTIDAREYILKTAIGIVFCLMVALATGYKF